MSNKVPVIGEIAGEYLILQAAASLNRLIFLTYFLGLSKELLI